ncbi:MAG: PAS domain S-box protein [Armatimonadetes bacterium]|nr:PAS domain S-box protein [Armatimonadota bacterium]
MRPITGPTAQELSDLVERRWHRLVELTQAWLAEHEASVPGLLWETLWSTTEAERSPEEATAAPTGPPVLVRALVSVLRGVPDEALVAEVARASLEDHTGEDRVQEVLVALEQGLEKLLAEEGHSEAKLRRAGRLAVEALRRRVEALHTQAIEEKATAAQSLLERLYDAVGKAIIICDAQSGAILRVNRAAATLLGKDAGQLQGAQVPEVLPEFAQRDWPRALQVGPEELLDFEMTLQTADGTRFLQGVAGKFRDAGREIVHLALADVTDRVELSRKLSTIADDLRRQVQDQLREIQGQRQFFRSVVDALPLRMLVLDQDLRIVHANPAYYQGRGVTPEEVIGRKLNEVFPKEILTEAGLEAALASAVKSGRPARWSGYRMATEDHGERIVDVRVDPCAGPEGQTYILLTIEDVTARHRQLYERTILQQVMRAMLEAQDLPRLLYAILTGMTAGGSAGLGFNRAFLLLVDEDSGVLRGQMAVGPGSREEAYKIWSEVAAEYHSIEDFMRDYDRLPPPEERPLAKVVEKMVFPLTDAEHLPVLALARGRAIHVAKASQDARVDPKLQEALQVEEFVVAPMLVQDRPIGVAIADNFVTGQPIRDDHVALLTALANHAALAIDRAQAHERERQRAEELARTQEELVRSNQLAAIGQMSAIVAHEIRNPLATIGGFALILQRTPDDPERVKRNARIIREEVERLERILEELLEFSRPRQLMLEPVAPGDLLHTLADHFKNDPQAARVEVQVEAEDNLPQIMIDKALMKQALTNLMRNAVEAMPTGGRLTLRARAWNGGVAIDVEDTGMGIPPDKIDSIFDPFVTTKPTGTGLGLALSQAIVQQHGARLSVHSKVGEGSTFTIEFPIHPVPTEVSAVTFRRSPTGPLDNDVKARPAPPKQPGGTTDGPSRTSATSDSHS